VAVTVQPLATPFPGRLCGGAAQVRPGTTLAGRFVLHEILGRRHRLAALVVEADRVAQAVVAEDDGRIVGAIRFQLEDQLFWPDLDGRDSAFVHRLAVRRTHAGRGVSTELLQWAVDRARSLGKRCLRLDCDADRTRLRALYERFGFRLHSYRQVGAYYVSRYELPL